MTVRQATPETLARSVAGAVGDLVWVADGAAGQQPVPLAGPPHSESLLAGLLVAQVRGDRKQAPDPRHCHADA